MSDSPRRILLSLVVNNRLMDDEATAFRKRLVSLREQRLFLLQVPVVEDMPHHKHVGLWQRVGEEVAGIEPQAVTEVE